MIEVKHLCKRYGEHVAVDDLSFTIENGHVYGFLGPNGAGKSTTIQKRSRAMRISANMSRSKKSIR